MPQCAGITKNGTRCLRDAKVGFKGCFQHLNAQSSPAPVRAPAPAPVRAPAPAPVLVPSPVSVRSSAPVLIPVRVPIPAPAHAESSLSRSNEINKTTLNDLPVELHLMILKDMKISDLLELRSSSRAMKTIIDDIIKKRFEASFSFPESYTMQQKIKKLKVSEIYKILINTDNYIYELFLTLANGNTYYINKSSCSFNPEMNFKAKIVSASSGDSFYHFVERNINKFDLLNLSEKDIYNNYKSLFIPYENGNNTYSF